MDQAAMDQAAMDQAAIESMIGTENIFEEVIAETNENDDESYSLTTNEVMTSVSDSDLSRSLLNVQEAIFNPATGTLQPISSASASPPRSVSARTPKKKQSQQQADLVMDQSAIDQQSIEQMMDSEGMFEEVIPGSNDDERFILTTNEAMPANTDLSQNYLNVQEAIFNLTTGTLQPIPTTSAASSPSQVKTPKKQNQQPTQTKYVIAQQSGDGQQQQIILDAQSLQGLLQGGGNTITFSGASGKQSIFLAPQSQTPEKTKTTKSPAKILPAPIPIGDQQQQQASTQKFLLKQGTVLTPISQGGGTTTTRLIQIPSTGPNQPVQYLRVVQKSQVPSNKVPIAPATYKPKPVAPKPSPGQQQTIFTLPSGATADLSSLQNVPGLGNFVVLPNYATVKSEHNTPVPIRPAHDILQSGISETAAILGGMNQNVSGHGSYESFRSLLEPNGMRPRKPCNCTKSQCLKLYCDCFANGEFCHLCNCTNCYNNLNHEEDRQKAIKLVLERNPGAFRPKIGKSSQTGEAHERRHNKGCNCRRSGCLKNYCECYEAKIFCSGICKCTGCKNCIENIPSGLPNGVGVEQHFAGAGTSHRQTLKDLAEAAEVRVQQQTQVKNKMKAQMQEVSPQNNLGIMVPPVVFRYPHGSISYDVVTSTVEVLLAKAEAIERSALPDGELESAILEEFGDCISALMELGSTVGINNTFN